eukprot:TRINITY_DN76891_c0_g1_i1.p1 TRINITY_DN76891_c0_g1~~TRINITY_DN76891_c0_g1_i1.p1  ORF type:complete len:341 (+),score=83.35 TRINITY_DN76891_c0_g1_i1:60-1025(+)
MEALDDDEYQEIELDDGKDEEDADSAEEFDELLQQACLPVSGEPMPPSEGPPTDADEYLRQVQWERMRCPQVVDVKIEEKPNRRKKKRVGGRVGTMMGCFTDEELPAEVQPTREWVEDVSDAFRNIQQHARVALVDGEKHSRLTYDEWRDRCTSDRPSTPLLADQDYVSIHTLCSVAVDLLVETQEAFNPTTPFVENGGVLAEWAFATLIFLEEPIVDQIQFQLQRLRRACRKALVVPTTSATPTTGAVDAVAIQEMDTSKAISTEAVDIGSLGADCSPAVASTDVDVCRGTIGAADAKTEEARPSASLLHSIIVEVFGQR